MRKQKLQWPIQAENVSSVFSQSNESLEKNLKQKVQKVQFDSPIISSRREEPLYQVESQNKIIDQSPPLEQTIKLTKVEYQSNQKKKSILYRDSFSINKKIPSVQIQNTLFFKIMVRKRFVNTFITNLKRWSYIHQTSSSQQQKLLEEQYLIEKDSDQNKFNENNLENRLQQSNDQAQIVTFSFFNIQVFEPQSFLMFLWKAFRTIIQLQIFWFMPFLLSFQIGSLSFIWDLEVIFFVVLLLDGFVSLNLAYIQKGQVVRSRQKIWKHYIKHYALKDFIEFGSLCLIFIFESQPWILIFVLVYVYLSTEKISSTVSSVQENFPLKGIMNEALSLIKLIIFVVLISHICACLWHFVGQQSIKYGYNSWILQKNLGQATIFSLYNYSFYWATMTMVTVGYGDVSPQNDLEVCVASCTMFVTCGVFAFAINTIGNSLSNIKEQKVKTQKAFSQINQYMSSHLVCYELQGRVRNYLEYCFKQDRDVDDEDVEYIVEKLPLNIRQELIKQIRGKALVQCRFIKKTFSQDIQDKLLPLMERLRFSPDEVIFKENAQDDSSIYMIQQGKVELICNDRVLKTLEIGDSFGERSFFTSQTRCCTIKAVDFVKVYKLSQESALSVLLNYPADKEKWCNIRDQISLQEKYEAAKMSCYSCGQSNHLITTCPVLFYKPNLERILKQGEFRDGQDRSKQDRKGSKQSSLVLYKELQEYTRIFQTTFIGNDSSYVEEDVDNDILSEEGSYNILSQGQESSSKFSADQFQEESFSLQTICVPQQSRDVSPGKSVSKIRHRKLPNYSNQYQEINDQENKNSVLLKHNDKFKNSSPFKYDDENIALKDREINIYHTIHMKKVPDLKIIHSQQKLRNVPRNDYQQQDSSQYSVVKTEKQKNKKSLFQTKKFIEMSSKFDSNTIQQQQQYAQAQKDQQKIQLISHSEWAQNNAVYTIGETDRYNTQSRAKKQSPQNSPSIRRFSLSTMKPKVQDLITDSYLKQQSFIPKQIETQSIQNQSFESNICHRNMVVQIDCDQMQQFDYYFPHNNYEPVIKQSHKLLKAKNKILDSRYTLYYSVKKSIQRTRKHPYKNFSQV